MTQYTYVLVYSTKTSEIIDGCIAPNPQPDPRADLGSLLAQGWTPVRETAAGENWLVVLQKNS